MVQVGMGCSNPIQVAPYSAQLDTWSRGQRLCSCASDSWLLYLTTSCGHDCYDLKPCSQSWDRMQQQHATTVNCRTSGHTGCTLDTGVSSSGICLQKSYQSADNATTHTSVNCLNIRSHARDVYLGMYPVQNGVSYLNVLAHFGETSRTVAKKNN